MADQDAGPEIAMDQANLYHEETFTDRRIGTLQRLTPVTAQGEVDTSRPVLFLGQTQIMTPAGALPLSFEIPASSLEDAASKFGEQAKLALHDTMAKLEELRREAASSLIVPGSDVPGGFPRGGVPGGGIQIP